MTPPTIDVLSQGQRLYHGLIVLAFVPQGAEEVDNQWDGEKKGEDVTNGLTDLDTEQTH
jgi:hypothetical protein